MKNCEQKQISIVAISKSEMHTIHVYNENVNHCSYRSIEVNQLANKLIYNHKSTTLLFYNIHPALMILFIITKDVICSSTMQRHMLRTKW